MTREEWLVAALAELRPYFKGKGYTIPAGVRVGVGFPPSGAFSRRKRVLGICCAPTMAKDAREQVYISPTVDDPVRILDILVHELAHTVAGNKAKHGPRFARIARALGLEGKPTATVAGDELKAWLEQVARDLGELDHSAVDLVAAEKKQSTRMLKASCPECDYTIRLTRKWADVGLPSCPVCDVELVLEQKDDDEKEEAA